MVHILLLLQFGENPRTKNYQDFEQISDAVKFICSKYEEFLKRKNPNQPYISYNIIDLYSYIDSVKHFS
jgi:Enhancer of rudimentary